MKSPYFLIDALHVLKCIRSIYTVYNVPSPNCANGKQVYDDIPQNASYCSSMDIVLGLNHSILTSITSFVFLSASRSYTCHRNFHLPVLCFVLWFFGRLPPQLDGNPFSQAQNHGSGEAQWMDEKSSLAPRFLAAFIIHCCGLLLGE